MRSAIAVLGNDSDVDGDTLVDRRRHASGAARQRGVNPDGTVTYTPDANYNGADASPTRSATARRHRNTATVAVTVTAVNDAPVAVNDTATTAEDTPVSIAVLANDTDVDGDTLTVERRQRRARQR